MVTFRTRFWDLLSEKEKREGSRYNNISEMSDAMGISRVTLYKYANDELSSVDAGTIWSLMTFLDLSDDDLHRLLYIGNPPQLNAQEADAATVAA